MAGMRTGRTGRRTGFALFTIILTGWTALSALPASADAAAGRIVAGRTVRHLAAAGPVDHKSTNILFEVLVGLGILVVMGVLVYLITRGRGRPDPGSGGGGGGGGDYHPSPTTPPGGLRVDHASEDEEKSPVLQGSPPQ
jgi:hypothetical protein